MLWTIVGYLYFVYNFFARLLWMIRGEHAYHYLIDFDGNQLPLNDYNFTHCAKPALLLVIFYTTKGIRYRFIELEAEDTLEDVRSAFRTYVAPPYNIFACVVDIKDHEYDFDMSEFLVLGNHLFTPTFNQWLCKHYYHIPSTPALTVQLLDNEMNLLKISSSIRFSENGWRAEKAPKEENDEVPKEENDEVPKEENKEVLKEEDEEEEAPQI